MKYSTYVWVRTFEVPHVIFLTWSLGCLLVCSYVTYLLLYGIGRLLINLLYEVGEQK